MFCPECGKEIKDDSKFCTYCGKRFEQQEPEPTVNDEQGYAYPVGVPQESAYAPQEDVYAPQENVYAPQENVYAPQNAGYAAPAPRREPKPPRVKRVIPKEEKWPISAIILLSFAALAGIAYFICFFILQGKYKAITGSDFSSSGYLVWLFLFPAVLLGVVFATTKKLAPLTAIPFASLIVFGVIFIMKSLDGLKTSETSWDPAILMFGLFIILALVYAVSTFVKPKSFVPALIVMLLGMAYTAYFINDLIPEIRWLIAAAKDSGMRYGMSDVTKIEIYYSLFLDAALTVITICGSIGAAKLLLSLGKKPEPKAETEQ